jgi:hypothetical protein
MLARAGKNTGLTPDDLQAPGVVTWRAYAPTGTDSLKVRAGLDEKQTSPLGLTRPPNVLNFGCPAMLTLRDFSGSTGYHPRLREPNSARAIPTNP